MMRKTFFLFSVFLLLCACAKRDPILPGQRTPVFGPSLENAAEKGEIPESVLSSSFARIRIAEPQEKYLQSADNEIFEVLDAGKKRKIFSGFPTISKVDVPRIPAVYKGFVYAGLTTGELVKINPRTREVAWVADIYKDSDMLGGGSVSDIVAPVVIAEGRIFAGGMGGAFCEVGISGGGKKWCAEIAVAAPFAIAGDLGFVPGADGTLRAVDLRDGTIYWKAKVKSSAAPRLESADGKYFVIVGDEKFSAADGTYAN